MANTIGLDGKQHNLTQENGLKRLESRHRQIMRMEILGHNRTQIADALGMTTQALYVICKSPLYVAEKERMEKDAEDLAVEKSADHGIRKFFATEAEPSANVLKTLRDNSKDDNVRFRSAASILDRAGYAPKASEGKGAIIQINISEGKVAMMEKADELFRDANRRPQS